METSISQIVPSINSKDQCDALSNNFIMQNIENNTRDTTLCISVISKSVPISISSTSTKNNKPAKNRRKNHVPPV